MKKPTLNQGHRKTILDNFQVSSFKLNSVAEVQSQTQKRMTQKTSKQPNEITLIPSNKESSISLKKNNFYYNNDFSDKGFIINGMNYFTESLAVNESAEVLEDCYSVKGDYFYLKKGQVIKINSKVGEYLEIKNQKCIGYFPTKALKLL